MERGPFRVPQASERRSGGSPAAESTERAAELRPATDAPRPVHRLSSRREKKDDTPKRKLVPIVVASLIVVGLVVGWFVWSSLGKNSAPAIDSSKYQAVFFTNGQVYFGKLQATNGDYLKLTDVFYLQAQNTEEEESDSENPQEASTDQNNVQLIKLGDEIHGPEDQMIISKDQVLFYENLKNDGKVAQSISKYKKP